MKDWMMDDLGSTTTTNNNNCFCTTHKEILLQSIGLVGTIVKHAQAAAYIASAHTQARNKKGKRKTTTYWV